MSKININFNNTTYQVDESALSAATSALQSHFSTVMNGSGATINFGGQSYNIDATKLSAATTEFVTHLGTISGNGYKIKVGGVEYGVGTDKVAGAVGELETAFGNLASGGGSTPDVPTEERLEGDGAEYYTLAPTALSFRSTAPLNELQEVRINGVTVDPSNYTLEEGSTIVTFPIEYLKTLDVGSYEVAVASDSKTVKGDFTVAAPELNEYGFYYNQPYTAYVAVFGGETAFFAREDGTYDVITIGKYPTVGEYTINGNNVVAIDPVLGTFTCTISSDGTEFFCNELQVAFKLSNSTSIAADENYIYVYMENLGGYEVNVIHRMQSSYGDIKTGINGIPTIKLADEMFVRIINGTYVDNMALIKAPEIPNSVTTIGAGAFFSCTNMTSVTIPESVTYIGVGAFSCCTNLVDITYKGTIGEWNAIAKVTNWNHNVPATYVQCTDGQVAL